MIVIADASPVNYLILIDQIEILPKLYGEIVIPQSVLAELMVERSPAPVRSWASLPDRRGFALNRLHLKA